jgi:hypothetical protein
MRYLREPHALSAQAAATGVKGCPPVKSYRAMELLDQDDRRPSLTTTHDPCPGSSFCSDPAYIPPFGDLTPQEPCPGPSFGSVLCLVALPSWGALGDNKGWQ